MHTYLRSFQHAPRYILKQTVFNMSGLPKQLIVALVLVNVVIAVLLDEFSKAAEKKEAFMPTEDSEERDRYVTAPSVL